MSDSIIGALMHKVDGKKITDTQQQLDIYKDIVVRTVEQIPSD
jgi:hypothetical protein